ncbi:Uncharacterized protein HZ326_23068 [Fusarium oxysporum f. sp. albedinis]|nr:Uncharacterized protein HZ326_23068 [Fusarium oxysporum f. sp. albedinis]
MRYQIRKTRRCVHILKHFSRTYDGSSTPSRSKTKWIWLNLGASAFYSSRLFGDRIVGAKLGITECFRGKVRNHSHHTNINCIIRHKVYEDFELCPPNVRSITSVA